MAAASLLNPNPSLAFTTSSRPLRLLCCSSPLSFRSAALSSGRPDRARRLFLSKGRLGGRSLVSARRSSRIVPLAAPHEGSKNSDIEVEEEETDLETKAHESEEAWKEMLESFKEEAMKLKDMSSEAYAVYSKKALVILKETSETLKIQADKARHDLAILAKEISEDGKGYFSSSPDYVKEVVEVFSSTADMKDLSAVRDFYVGIPYGAFLAVGGFLSFMLTESISAIRFGLILGTALLYLSYLSLRSWKSGQPSEFYLKGQAGIAAVIFIRVWGLFFQRRSFSTSLMTLLSGVLLAFYIYRIYHDSGKGQSSAQDSEN